MATETPSQPPPVTEYWRDAPQPGLYPGVPYDDYARWRAAHHSLLRHFNRTAAHARQQLIAPSDQTDDQRIGHAGHVCILEPDRFDREYVAAPKFDKRTNVGKQGWAEFQAGHKGFALLPVEEYDLCLRMRDAVWSHPTARELLQNPGENELSVSWIDQETGVPCKARLDRMTTLSGWGVLGDLKTSKDASRRAFERDVFYLKYHQQAALYLDGADALSPHPRKFMFVVVEKDPPYCVAVYELDEDAINLGRDDYQKHLAMYARCVETGQWPGYSDGADYVSVPPWAFKVIDGGGQ